MSAQDRFQAAIEARDAAIEARDAISNDPDWTSTSEAMESVAQTVCEAASAEYDAAFDALNQEAREELEAEIISDETEDGRVARITFIAQYEAVQAVLTEADLTLAAAEAAGARIGILSATREKTRCQAFMMNWKKFPLRNDSFMMEAEIVTDWTL